MENPMLQKTILAAFGALAFLASTPALHASDEFVYVESNIKTPNGNSIFAFQRQSDGSLKSLPGSPFLMGGAGVQDISLQLGPSDSDQDIATNNDHTLLFAVNSGSDSIAVFHINGDGSLTPVNGSPFPSGGTDPVSVSLRGNVLFVVNKNGDFPRENAVLPNYTTFRVQHDGVLVPNDAPNAIVSVALNSSPTQAFLAPQENVLFGADFIGGLLQSIRFDENGSLHQNPAQALPASAFSDTTTPRLSLGVWSHPQLPLLYVGFVTVNQLGVYRYNENGHLTFLRSVPNSGNAICWLRTNRYGSRLYSSDTGTNSISVYDLSDPQNPVEIQNLVLAGLGNVLQFTLSSDEHYLYAVSSRGSASIPEGQGNALHILQIASDGTVTETAKSPILLTVPPGNRPQGVLAVNLR
jgi:hypothetical protein